MEEQIKTAMRFYLIATSLKYKIRCGWDENHWNINSNRLESIAEHVYGVCILAISLNSQFNFDIDINKTLKMLLLHEIGETIIGDITPFDNITTKEKAEIEHKAMRKVLEGLYEADEIYALLLEFDEGQTNEARFAYLCDKLEADIQAKVYQDKGYQRSLDDQEGNVAFNSPKINRMIENGASTAFDIWYEWDKSKFENDPVFKYLLDFIRDNDLNVEKGELTNSKSSIKI